MPFPTDAPDDAPSVVILGSGFGGFAVARRLERILAEDEARIVMIADNNYHLFTPMLAEVAGGAVEAWHVAAPLRRALPRTRFVHGRVVGLDPEGNVVRYRPALGSGTLEVAFDQVVVALGSEPHTHGTPGVEDHALAFRRLTDASRLRNHVIALLEEASAEPASARADGLLTFVVVGAGYSGVEIVTHLRDLVRDLIDAYEGVTASDLRFVIVHPHERIVPQISESLAKQVRHKLERDGVELVLEQHVVEVGPDAVTLESGERIATHTPVWTAGVRPNRSVGEFGLPVDDHGAIRVGEDLRVRDMAQVWAIGDCAAVPNVLGEGETCPATAQHAYRQGSHVARNVAAVLRGQPATPFRYRSPGMMVPLGRRDAAAEIYGLKLSGRLAWFMWRTVYWTLLPSWSKKARVAMDWTADLLFGRETVLTRDPLVLGTRRSRGTEAGIEGRASDRGDDSAA